MPEVFLVCSIDGDGSDAECEDRISKAIADSLKFKQLINTKKEISCSDFVSKKEAESFYHYISGEEFNRLQQILTNVVNDRTEAILLWFGDDNITSIITDQAREELNKKLIVGAPHRYTPANYKHCTNDPYGLDTDGDCEPCENYSTGVDAQMEKERLDKTWKSVMETLNIE